MSGTPVGASAIPPPVLPQPLGVNIHFTDPRPGEMKTLADAGFKWVRMDFAWEGTEKAKGVYDFAAYDRLMTALAPYNIHPLFILDYSNPLYDQGQSPQTEEGRAAFAKWAAAAAQHFRGRGILWEMYNEPNIGFWKPHPDVQQYIQLALAVGKALRLAAPDETYIGPGVSGMDFSFLEACFKAGMLDYWSAVSVHPYRQAAPESAAGDFRRLRLMIARYGPAGKSIPIISSEWGYSSVWGGMTEEKQARMLAREWLSNVSNDIALSIWYDWHDDGLSPTDPEAHFGTVLNPYHEGRDPVYDPKPAYRAARALTSSLDGYHFNKRLALESPDDYVLLFSKGTDVRVVAWTTAADAHPITIPASPGRFHVRSFTGDILPPLDSTSQGLTVMATDAPQYLAPENPNDLLRVGAAWSRVPLEVMAEAPAQVRLLLRLKNPLDRTVSIHARDQTEDGGRGKTLAFDTVTSVTRSSAPIPVRITWNVEGMGALSQETQILVQNPLDVMFLPAQGVTLPIQVLNPSGDAFDGRLVLSGTNGQSDWRQEMPLKLTAGQENVTVDATIPQGSGTGYSVQGKVLDAQGRTALDVPASRLQLVDDFSRYPAGQAPPDYSLVTDGDPKVASDQALTVAPPPEGPPTPGMGVLRITYRFDPGWKFIRLVSRKPEINTITGKPRGLGMWIDGDGQGGQARIRFTDSTGQTFQPSGEPIRWKGWKYVVFPLDGSSAGHWGGTDDGIVHYPIQFDSLFLLDGNREAMQGTVYLGAPTLIE